MLRNKKSLAINSVLNVIKQLCVIIFPMITFPYASRVLGVTNYGKINFGQSIISYITLIAALGITNYAIREGAQKKDEKKELSQLINELFSLNLYSTLLSYVILALLCLFWSELSSYTLLLVVQSLIVIFTTLGADWINTIFEDYFFITVRYIVCQVISIFLMFILVKKPDDYLLYAFVSVSSNILANIWNIYHIKCNLHIKIQLVGISKVKEHLKPVFFLFASSVATLFYINSDITMLGIIKNDRVVGYYSVSVKIYTLIKQLLNAFMIVSIPRFSSYLGKGMLQEVRVGLNNLFTTLVLITGPALVGLFSLSSNIIMIFAGENYLQATSSLQILSIALFFSTLACYYINVVMIPFKKEKIILRATFFSAITNIILNFILIPRFGADAAAFTTLISEFLLVIFGVYYMKGSIRIKWRVPTLLSIIISLFVYYICYFVSTLDLSNIQEILFSAVLSILVFLLIAIPYFRKMKFRLIVK